MDPGRNTFRKDVFRKKTKKNSLKMTHERKELKQEPPLGPDFCGKKGFYEERE